MKVAILGAGGFIGGRLFERWKRAGRHQPRAVVRTPAGLARLARFAQPDWKLADARDEAALKLAFAGCEAVVHCVVGDERVIAATLQPVYRAAAAAGVRAIVYLSSASVHGLAPAAGTDESSPLRDDQPLSYNNAKVRAERQLRTLAADGAVRSTVLRPGIVYGPRSRWVTDVADALRERRAWWIDGGQAICNAIHVDNLAHAIECALARPDAAGEAYLVGDRETVRWRDLYLGVAGAMGCDETAFAEAVPAAIATRRTWAERLEATRTSDAVQAALPWFPWRLKRAAKAALAGWRGDGVVDTPAAPGLVHASREMTMLFTCRARLPIAKAQQRLGYAPPVSFPAGLADCARWLALAGYGPAGGPGTEPWR